MKVILLGRKPEAIQALDFLLARGWEVPCVVCPKKISELWWSPTLFEAAKHRGIPVVTQRALLAALAHPEERSVLGGMLDDVDLIISYLYWRRIKKPLINLPRFGVINFHPAPLPDYQGLGGYNFAILNGDITYGVSVHYVNETIDTGDIIARRDFSISSDTVTAYSLYQQSQAELLELYYETIPLFKNGSPPGYPQGKGHYYTREEFEAAKTIPAGSSSNEIDRRARAFWFPPYPGAYFADDPTRATVVPPKILEQLGKLLHQNVKER